jgi:hypothetical protein
MHRKNDGRTGRLGVLAAATTSPSLYTSTLGGASPAGAEERPMPPLPPKTSASCVHSPRGSRSRVLLLLSLPSSPSSVVGDGAGSGTPRGVSEEQAAPVAL